MRRRALLATLATTPLAGCSAIFGDSPNDGPATTPTHVVPRTPVPTPERPADLADDEAVAAYLREHEHATVHNRAVNGDRTVTSVQISCQGATSAHADGGVVGFAVCTGAIQYADGSHADLGRVPSAYYVAPDRTVRIDGFGARAVRERSPRDVFAAEDPVDNVAPADGRTRGLYVQNFDDAERRVTVSIDYLGSEPDRGSGTPTTAFERTYRLGPRSMGLQRDVAVRRGEYRVAVRLGGDGAGDADGDAAADPDGAATTPSDDHATATHRWRIDGRSGRVGAAVAVTPSPAVTVGPVDL